MKKLTWAFFILIALIIIIPFILATYYGGSLKIQKVTLTSIQGEFYRSPDLHARFSLQGKSLSLHVIGDDLQVNLEGMFQGSSFILTKEAHISFPLTEKTSSILFKNFSIRPTSRENISLSIEPQGAKIHLFPFNIKSVEIPSFFVEGGQIELEHIPIGFNQIPLSLSDGKVQITKTALFVSDCYELSLWGKVNIAEKSLSVKVGITGDLIGKVFGIRSIDPHFTIPVKIDGPWKELDIHKSKPLKELLTILLAEFFKPQ